jgi:metal-sulfur cluster biosynthetic enzyme
MNYSNSSRFNLSLTLPRFGEEIHMITEKEILAKINEINDPDIGIGLVDLGLVYKTEVTDGNISITMTLTTPLCPLAATFEKQISEKFTDNKDISKIKVEFTFDPPWSVERISEETRMRMGLLV